jgi:type II secretory pathway component PulJ
MARLGIGVIARYGNWYHGDDDFFTHCLILKNGECWLLGQGLEQVTARVFKAHHSKLKKLKAALSPIPLDGRVRATAGTISLRTQNRQPRARLQFTGSRQVAHWPATTCLRPGPWWRVSSRQSRISTEAEFVDATGKWHRPAAGLGPRLAEQLTGNISGQTTYSMVGVNHVLRPLWLLT